MSTPDSSLDDLLRQEPLPGDALLAAIAASFECPTGTLHRLDEATQTLHLVAQLGIPPALLPVIGQIPVGKGIAGAAAERREPVELCNLQADLGGVAKEGARATNVNGSLAVPCLSAEGRLYGTLGIGKPTPYTFTDEEKARLLQWAGRLAERLAQKL